jgi:hypothetical protein
MKNVIKCILLNIILFGCINNPNEIFTKNELVGSYKGEGLGNRKITLDLSINSKYRLCAEINCVFGVYIYDNSGISLLNVPPSVVEHEFSMAISPHPGGPLTKPARIYSFDVTRCDNNVPCFDFRGREGVGLLVLLKD